MPEYINDNVIPSFLSVSSNSFTSDGGANDNVSLRLGEVRNMWLASDTKNVSKKYTEYDVLVFETNNGTAASTIYNNCGVSCLFGSVADKFVWTPRFDPTPKISGGDLVGTGSKVLLLCLNGQTSNAMIIGAVRDDKDFTESKYTENKNPGHHLLFQFNGMEASIDKDGQLVVTYGGKTENDGKTNVPESQTGTTLSMTQNGNVSIQDKDNKNQVLVNHADSKVENTADTEWNAKVTAGSGASAVLSDGSAVTTATNIKLDGQIVSIGKDADSFLVRGTELQATLVALVTALNTFAGTVVPVTGATGGPALVTALIPILTQLQNAILSQTNKLK